MNNSNEQPSDTVATVTPMSRPAVSAAPRRLLAAAAGLAALVVLAGCASNAPQDTFDPAGENARRIDNLQRPVFIIAGVIGVLVMIVVGVVIVRFRDRGQPLPEQSHGKPALEIGLTILPAIILIGIAVPTVGTLMALERTDDTECVVNVTANQWWFEIDYPVQENCGGVAITSPIVTSGEMVIPANTRVLLRGTSRDVIHSFWIPRLNGKRDLVPNRIHPLRMQADEPGRYLGQCGEFCGLSHANMRMEVIALDAAGFAAWVDKQLQPVGEPTSELAAEGKETFINMCARCHQVNGLVDGSGNPVIAQPENNVYNGAAPNLTHLMTRTTFAGATWPLLTEQCRDQLDQLPADEFTAGYLEGTTAECLNSEQLRNWMRDAPAERPMYTAGPLLATNGLPRGMPNLGMSEAQIQAVEAYLLEATR